MSLHDPSAGKRPRGKSYARGAPVHVCELWPTESGTLRGTVGHVQIIIAPSRARVARGVDGKQSTHTVYIQGRRTRRQENYEVLKAFDLE